jgi:hypothetical protein
MVVSPMLTPVVVLVAWSLVMWLWLYATRLPAMSRAKVKLDPRLPPGELVGGLPAEVRWKADNYNHLMEQPTIFYAVALALAVADMSAGDAGSGLNIILAWFYVILRIIHSLIQATVNIIMLRFAVFTLSTLCLIGLTYGALQVVFGF